ncbi:DUF3750 domain-containing protein [Rhodopirellula sp. JC639]|uniref:DUF3750 domain-containing protein n=1 Tax=Stieleria mannarensis TaxID=2755585 RepID=UPI00160490A2
MKSVPESPTPPSVTVELWAARLPGPFRFAEHCWLLVRRGDDVDRWEVWQDADCGGESWGHVHRNLLAPTAGIRNHPAYWLHQWHGQPADHLARRIEDAPNSYPWCGLYRYVPGPNSNTFVQWCLEDRYRLSWRSVGAGYARRAAGRAEVVKK